MYGVEEDGTQGSRYMKSYAICEYGHWFMVAVKYIDGKGIIDIGDFVHYTITAKFCYLYISYMKWRTGLWHIQAGRNWM